ncbi:hypothetical protein J4471_01105 [Candidatus Woesearchaeota archaeon]|nr:hypothetical protein [Candidatus Woesearchaeota archaeon]
MIIELLIALVLVLFVPGYLIVQIFFKNITILEKITLSISFSIIISFIISIMLGFIKVAEKVYGFNRYYFSITLAVLSILFFMIWYFLARKNIIL